MRICIIGEGQTEGRTEIVTEETQKAIESISESFHLSETNEHHMDVVVIQSLKSLMSYYQAGQQLEIINNSIDNYKPDLLIIATNENRELLVPIVGERYDMNTFIQCTDILFDSRYKKTTICKPMYGGNVNGYIELDRSSVVGFRHNIKTVKQDVTKLTNISIHHVQPDSNQLQCVNSNFGIVDGYFEWVEQESMTDAELVIVCGYGVESSEQVKRIEKYAKRIGAVVGGTKKVIDYGWLPIHKLVGQTGMSVSPKLCLCIGVSGATPFVNGILDSEKIVAINNDSNARIFQYADVGIVEDYKSILNL